MAQSSSGVGPHGYDWLVGNWTCSNTARQPIGGPATQHLAISRSSGGVAVRSTGVGYERTGYLAYVAATKTWWQTFSYPNGDHYVESTTQTGTKTVWPGSFTDVSTGRKIPVRESYTVVSPTELNDIGQFQSGGVWKTGFSGTCKKT